MADKCQPDGSNLWNRLNCHIRRINNIPNAPDPGQPDSLIVKNNHAFFVEYKNDDSALSLVSDNPTGMAYRPNQHRYAIAYGMKALRTNIFVWVRLGNARVDLAPVITHQRDKKMRLPKRTWLIPYPAFVLGATFFLAHQRDLFGRVLRLSIPYTAAAARETEIRDIPELGFDVLFAKFALEWTPKVGWELPRTHYVYENYFTAFAKPKLYHIGDAKNDLSPAATATAAQYRMFFSEIGVYDTWLSISQNPRPTPQPATVTN